MITNKSAMKKLDSLAIHTSDPRFIFLDWDQLKEFKECGIAPQTVQDIAKPVYRLLEVEFTNDIVRLFGTTPFFKTVRNRLYMRLKLYRKQRYIHNVRFFDRQ